MQVRHAARCVSHGVSFLLLSLRSMFLIQLLDYSPEQSTEYSITKAVDRCSPSLLLC